MEFKPFTLPNAGSDVIVLAGDIGTGLQGINLARGWSQWQHVVYVSGNHELYGGSYPSHINAMRAATIGYPNLHFMENDQLVIDNVRFLACTLWTDFTLYGDGESFASMRIAARGMSDYMMIKCDDDSRLAPENTRHIHLESIAWLKDRLAEPFDGSTVVVTHHCPSDRFIEPRFRQRKDGLTPAFASNLESMMGPPIDLWIAGHSHYNVDLDINGTRCLSNQRGYPGEKPPGLFNPELVIEV